MRRGPLISYSQGKGHKKAMAMAVGPTMLQYVKTKQVSKEIESVKDTLVTADELHRVVNRAKVFQGNNLA